MSHGANSSKKDLSSVLKARGVIDSGKSSNSPGKISQKELRKDQSFVGAWLPKEVLQQVKIMAAEQGIKQKDLMVEALNDFFRKHNKPEIAK